jgi:methoxymalonate biosynthesis acyl carrier protein
VNDLLPRIRAYVEQHVNHSDLADDEDIFANGHATSLFAVQLVMWVERTFGVAAEGRDLDLANFRSIAAMHRFVESRVGLTDGRNGT